MRSFLALILATSALGGAAAAEEADEAAVARGVEQLRASIGTWDTTTEFLEADGTVARSVQGTYFFDWVVPDRVISGRSDMPALDQASGILFYLTPKKGLIEMVSVGADGHLWVMSGPIGGETRTTPPTTMSDGSTLQLRFTRFNVSRDRFESRMELTTDGGKTWVPGNHQVMVRRGTPPAG